MITIHGVPFYGRLNLKHKIALANVSNVTTKDEWNGIKGVFTTSGFKPIGLREYTTCGQYARFTRINSNSYAIVTLIHGNNQSERFRVYKSPIIFVDGRILQREEDFIFTLLHEVGHHNNRHSLSNKQLTKKDIEVEAHLFALERYYKLYTKLNILNYRYISDAIEEYEKMKS